MSNCLLLYGLSQCNLIRQKSKPLGVFLPIIGNIVKTEVEVLPISEKNTNQVLSIAFILTLFAMDLMPKDDCSMSGIGMSGRAV